MHPIPPLRALVRRASAALSDPREILSSRFVSAKLLPLDEQRGYAVLMRAQTDTQAEQLPVPPLSLSSRWGLTTDSYLRGGQIDAETILAHLAEVDATVEPGSRVLDFGCAEGRVIRFFPRDQQSELWGVDINAERIAWAQRHLPPPFRFATTTTAPHLPFEDNYFDLVYAVSVFTHISELGDAWFLELLRVLRPGGHAYLTIHDEHTVELLRGAYRDNPTHAYMVDLVRKFDEATGVLDREWAYFTILADPAAQVFYDAAYLVDKWSRLAVCVRVTPEAIGYQTALIFRKADIQTRPHVR
jgi:ubiquinone/menaquinone biosynthesis C-methylase UbiE